MIAFRLYHTLHLQYKEFFSGINADFESTLYAVKGNDLLALSSPVTSLFSFDRSVMERLDMPIDYSKVDVSEMMMIEEGSDEGEVMKYLLLILRRWRRIEPYANDYMTESLRGKLNQKLKYYDLEMIVPGLSDAPDEDEAHDPAEGLNEMSSALAKGGTAPSDKNEVAKASDVAGNALALFSHRGAAVTLEKAIGIITARYDSDLIKKNIKISFEEAERLRILCYFEEARDQYLLAMKEENVDSTIYTRLCMGLAESFYFLDDLRMAAELYGKCDVSLIPDADDLYIRLGHCYLDEKMKEHSGYVKTYYRSKLSTVFRNRYEAEVNSAASYVGEDFDEYEEMCLKIGRSKYQQAVR